MQPKRAISIRRTHSIGDVLAATCVATALQEMGYPVIFQSDPFHHAMLRRVPKMGTVIPPNRPAQINLDGAYENHPERTTRHIAEMYIEKANADLDPLQIRIPAVQNFAPKLVCEPELKVGALKLIAKYPKPWVMICPRSNSWVNKTVPDAIWGAAAKGINGTCFWMGNHAPAPAGIVDAGVRSVDALTAFLACADLVLTTDTGPMHITAALGTPLIVINQSRNADLYLSDQRDFTTIAPTHLPCLACSQNICPLDATNPPCQNMPPEMISSAANDHLKWRFGNKISAVIAVYKPDIHRLNKCLKHVLPQVDEVIIVGDLDTPWPMDGVMLDDKIHLARKNAHQTGYGRKANYGARRSRGAFIWFLNDDVFLNEGVGEILVSSMRDGVAAVSHTLRYPDGKIQYAGKYRPRGACGFGHLDHRKENSRYTEPVEQESFCGASVLVRRDAFFAADGFDERYFLFSEDDSLAMQLRQNGGRLIFDPRAEATHDEHQSINITDGWKQILHESSLKFRDKWHGYFHRNQDPAVLGTFT